MFIILSVRKFFIATLLILNSILFADVKYLIITPSRFYDAVMPLAEWKLKKGLSTKIVTITEGLNALSIKDTIRVYRPQYVLLVGDKNYIPLGKYYPNWTLYYPTNRGMWTDQYYADTTDDAEYMDDIFLGRLPCSTPRQCSVMVNKTISYEKGNLRNSDWYIKATGIARDILENNPVYDSCYKTAIRIFHNLLRGIGFTQVDTLFRSGGADSATVQDSVTKGRGFVFYRGSTLSNNDNWNYPFGVNPSVINNDSMPSVVISPTCRTMFWAETLPSWPEPTTAAGRNWMRSGDITLPKGAVAFFGTTTHYYGPPNSFPDQQTFWRNAAGIRFFQSVANDSQNILGMVIRKAKDSAFVCCALATLGQVGSATACSVAYMEWNLLGDPELNLWTSIPNILTVHYDTLIPTGAQNFTVSVLLNANPVDNVLVCLMKDTSIYEYGFTNSLGVVSFSINPSDTGYIFITITKRNCKPVEGKIRIIPQYDVAVSEIIQPINSIDSTVSIAPKAKVINKGFADTTFNVKFSISGLWSSIKEANNLLSGEERIIIFDTWQITQRGRYLVKCSTELSNDFNPLNNQLEDSFRIQVRDFAVKVITNPNEYVDSGAVITPRAWIHNNGSTDETDIPVTFNVIGTDYSKQESLSLNAGDSAEINFTDFPANIPRGTYTIKCSTNLRADCVLSNDLSIDSFHIRIRDFSTRRIIEPKSPVDSGVKIVPKALIYNFGTTDEINVLVTFQIENKYQSTKTISLISGDSTEVVFDTFDFNLQRGIYNMSCSTKLDYDIVETNNCSSGQFTIITPGRDFAVTTIITPSQSVDSAAIIVPKAIIYNFGNSNEESIPFICYIVGTVYIDTQYVSLNSGNWIEQSFDSFIVNYPRGTYTIRCTTQLTGDTFEDNNCVTESFEVTVKDFGISLISAPNSPVLAGTKIYPKAEIHNYGTTNESGVSVTFDIIGTGYSSIKYVDLNQGDSIEQVFDSLIVSFPAGYYLKRCGTQLEGDIAVANNLLTETLNVINTGWTKMKNVPSRINNKGVKDGGALVAVANSKSGDVLYAFRGNQSNEFYRFDISVDTWTLPNGVASIPFTGKVVADTYLITPQKRYPGKGAAFCWDGNSIIYAIKGNTAREFWAYNINSDLWNKKHPTPSLKGIKGGSSLVYNPSDNKVYLLVGNVSKPDSNNFFVYNPSNDNWTISAKLPTGPYNKVWKDGSCLTIAENNKIYALKGGDKKGYFYEYDGSNWIQLESIPKVDTMTASPSRILKKTCTPKDGAIILAIGNTVYAVKGGGSWQLWTYDIGSNRWSQSLDDTIPRSTDYRTKSYAKTGAGMASAGDKLWLIKGNNTPEFWMYIPTIEKSKVKSTLGGQISHMSQSAIANQSEAILNLLPILNVSPNPFTKLTTIRYAVPVSGRVSLKLYNASGKLVQNMIDDNQHTGYYSIKLASKNLTKGIYFIKYKVNNYSANQKIIIN